MGREPTLTIILGLAAVDILETGAMLGGLGWHARRLVPDMKPRL